MNFSAIIPDLLVALRGKRSQRQLSKQMKFKFNKVGRWESGKVEISWADFVEFAKVVRRPLSPTLKSTFAYHGDAKDLPALLKHFDVKATDRWLKLLGVSRFTLSRWRKGESQPGLLVVLTIMHAGSSEMLRFFEELGVLEQIPSVSAENLKLERERQLHYNMPWASAVLCAIDSSVYKQLAHHSDRWIAKFAQLPESIVSETLRALTDHQVIEWQKSHYASINQLVSPYTSRDGVREIQKYWHARMHDFLKNNYPSPTSLSGYQCFNLDEGTFEKLREAHHRFYHEVYSIIEGNNSKGDKCYIWFNQIVDLQDLPN